MIPFTAQEPTFSEPGEDDLLVVGDVEEDVEPADSAYEADGLPLIINGFQVVSMEALSRRYSPNQFTVRLGVPVRWEIFDAGFSGCTNAIVSRELFS